MFQRLLALVAIGLLAPGCGPGKGKASAPGGERVLATIDGEPVTESDMQAVLSQYAHDPYVQARYSSPEHRRELLQNLILFKVMLLEARKLGLEKDPEVLRVRKELQAQAFIEKEINERVRATDIRDEEIADYYRKNNADFIRKEEIRLALILVRDKVDAMEVASRARALPPTDKAGFAALVAKYSTDDETKGRGGETVLLGQDTSYLPRELVVEGFALKKAGEIAGPIATSKGFGIIRLLEKRPPHLRPLAECESEIRGRLVERARAERLRTMLAEARGRANVVIDQNALAALAALAAPLPTDGQRTTDAGPSLPLPFPTHLPRPSHGSP